MVCVWFVLSSHRTNTEVEDDQEHESAEERIPTAWWVGGLMLSGAFCTAMLTPMLDLPVIDPLTAVGLALLVAVLAVRALGQTDLNPVSGVGKLSQVCCSGRRHHWTKKRKERKIRNDYVFWRQFNEKPSIIPGCPGVPGSHVLGT